MTSGSRSPPKGEKVSTDGSVQERLQKMGNALLKAESCNQQDEIEQILNDLMRADDQGLVTVDVLLKTNLGKVVGKLKGKWIIAKNLQEKWATEFNKWKEAREASKRKSAAQTPQGEPAAVRTPTKSASAKSPSGKTSTAIVKVDREPEPPLDRLKGREAAVRKRGFGGPPRPPTAFALWAREQKAEAKKAHPDAKDQELVKILHTKWDKLPQKTREPYLKREEKELKAWNVKRVKDDEEAQDAFDDDLPPPKKKRNRTAVKEKVAPPNNFETKMAERVAKFFSRVVVEDLNALSIKVVRERIEKDMKIEKGGLLEYKDFVTEQITKQISKMLEKKK